MSGFSPSSDGDGLFRGLTVLLTAVAAGDSDAVSKLWSLVHADVRSMAACALRGEYVVEDLAPTVLVHEAWLRLHGGEYAPEFANRRHFFGAVATSMRRILIDHARARRSVKRGKGVRPVSLQIVERELVDAGKTDPVLLEELMAAFGRFSELHPRAAEVGRLRYLLGLDVETVAGLLEISPRTVRSDWAFAKAWLRKATDETRPSSPRPAGGG
jgi:RNA polymerase sigma factor (TIGR02999 family)